MRRLVALVALLLPAACSNGPVRVDDAVVAAPSGDVAAAYMSIENASGTDVLLIAVRADSGRAEIHESFMEGGLMRMREVPSVLIAAGEVTRFEPGGYHIMLFDVAGLEAGSTVAFVLEFDDGAEYEVTAPVRPIAEIVP